MKNLLDVKIGKYATIAKISEQASIKIRRRLLDFGFTKGQRVRTIHKSILSKDYLVELRHFTLSLRSEIIKFVLVDE